MIENAFCIQTTLAYFGILINILISWDQKLIGLYKIITCGNLNTQNLQSSKFPIPYAHNALPPK